MLAPVLVITKVDPTLPTIEKASPFLTVIVNPSAFYPLIKEVPFVTFPLNGSEASVVVT